jgi:dolichol-phosphate mannosyltransferase
MATSKEITEMLEKAAQNRGSVTNEEKEENVPEGSVDASKKKRARITKEGVIKEAINKEKSSEEKKAQGTITKEDHDEKVIIIKKENNKMIHNIIPESAKEREIMVSIVFPTFNESSNIINLINLTNQALGKVTHEILVVDDDSPDKTWELAENLKDPHVRVIRRINEKKLVSAIQRGIDEAKGKYVVWMDADVSMHPSVIPSLIAQLPENDIAVGSRYTKGGKDARPLIRVVSSRFINLMANLILNFKVLDYDSGFVMAKKEVLNNIRLVDSGYGEYCIEFLYTAGKKGYKIKEVPYVFTDRRAGQSKTAGTLFNLAKYGWLYFKRIVQIRIKR